MGITLLTFDSKTTDRISAAPRSDFVTLIGCTITLHQNCGTAAKNPIVAVEKSPAPPGKWCRTPYSDSQRKKCKRSTSSVIA